MNSIKDKEKDRYKIKKQFIYRKYKGEGLLVNRDQQDYPQSKRLPIFQLNETGCVIIEQIKKGKTLEEIIFTLSKQYKISSSKAKKDINDFLKILRKAKILEK